MKTASSSERKKIYFDVKKAKEKLKEVVNMLSNVERKLDDSLEFSTIYNDFANMVEHLKNEIHKEVEPIVERIGEFAKAELLNMPEEHIASRLQKIARKICADKKYVLDVSYFTTTPESIEDGDFEDKGWEEQGVDFDNLHEMIQYMLKEGASEPSSNHFTNNIWYDSDPNTEDYSTGEQKTLSFHPKGVDNDEQKIIFESIKKHKNLAEESEE